jgi:hypothetical protein
MTLIILVFLGGALTIATPCVLPVLPFVFARAEQPFLHNGLPMLIGMALTFAAVATLAVQFYFLARDLHLVLAADHAVRFRVLLDGKAPGDDHGADIEANGNGTVREQRLYQLIRQSKDVREHDFSIQFLDDGVTAYAFTFG